MIVYPNRDPTEIGLRLRDAVPQKYRHLVNNIDPKDYQTIMKTLEERFGKARHIISSCVSEITKMKKPNTDEQYIRFVENLEKIKSDLEAVGLEKRLDHEEIMKKVEEKLPDAVHAKWLEYALANNLLDYDDVSDLFSKLLKFLVNFKKMADYKVGDIDVASGRSKSKFCVVTGVTL